MLDIRLFGEYREFAEDKRPTSTSKYPLPYLNGETIGELLGRIGIDPEGTGDILVNFAVAELDTVIPRDGSRVAIFPAGMVLLCGASHLKGHSYSQKKGQVTEYYGKPEVK